LACNSTSSKVRCVSRRRRDECSSRCALTGGVAGISNPRDESVLAFKRRLAEQLGESFDERAECRLLVEHLKSCLFELLGAIVSLRELAGDKESAIAGELEWILRIVKPILNRSIKGYEARFGESNPAD
jgi:hypothetical protein